MSKFIIKQKLARTKSARNMINYTFLKAIDTPNSNMQNYLENFQNIKFIFKKMCKFSLKASVHKNMQNSSQKLCTLLPLVQGFPKSYTKSKFND